MKPIQTLSALIFAIAGASINPPIIPSADSAELPAVSADAPTMHLDPVKRLYHSYDYEERSENSLKQVRLSIPDGLTTVRGILVVSNPGGGDSRALYQEGWYEAFLYLHGFAFLGAKGFNSHKESVQVMQNALQKIASDSHHPELINVPYATAGFSAGGGFASRLTVELPDRVIASVPICARLNLTGITPAASLLHTPVLIISGGNEKFEPVVEPVLKTYRPKGALYGWMTVQNGGHARYGQEVLAMPMLDAAVRLRYPTEGDARKGPIKLRSLPLDSGWVADNTSWQSGLTRIAPVGKFQGDIGKSSWLLNQDIAFIYRAYATYTPLLTITSPTSGASNVLDPGANVMITVDASKLPHWRKLEFYDGAHKLGEIAQGPTKFMAANLSPGYHAFSILGTDAQGVICPSNPVLVVVRSLTLK